MSKMNAFVPKLTVSEELRQDKVRRERRRTLRLVAWLAFWIVLFYVLHTLI